MRLQPDRVVRVVDRGVGLEEAGRPLLGIEAIDVDAGHQRPVGVQHRLGLDERRDLHGLVYLVGGQLEQRGRRLRDKGGELLLDEPEAVMFGSTL